MKALRTLGLAAALALVFTAGMTSTANAGYRQYYARWSYYPKYHYYYRHYYYKPYASYSGYRYHYCVYYPRRRYVYYYNPYRRVYWGRYDLESKGYSLLAKEDRKGSLKDIPESSFPKPGGMPAIPESKPEDGVKVDVPTNIPEGPPPTGGGDSKGGPKPPGN